MPTSPSPIVPSLDADCAAVVNVLWGDQTEAFRRNLRATLALAAERAHIAGHSGGEGRSPLLEAQITKTLAHLSGPAETHLVQSLCAEVGLDATPQMGLYTLRELVSQYPASYTERPRHGRPYTQVTGPDLVVAVVTPATDQTPETITPVIFIEAKGRNTAISFGWGYCKDDPDAVVWGSQPTCLPHGCWVEATTPAARRAFDNAKWVWLAPAETRTQSESAKPATPWERVPRPFDPTDPHAPVDAADVDAFEAALAAVRPTWHPLTVEQVADWISATPVDEPHVDIAYGRSHAYGTLLARPVTQDEARRGHDALARALREWARK